MTIDTFLTDILPQYEPDEGFVVLLMFRRKWLIAHEPEKEREYRDTFRSDQTLIGKAVLSGERKRFPARLRYLLRLLSPDVGKVLSVKGAEFSVADLYRKYPQAFSLMITFEPRSLVKAALSFCLNTLEEITKAALRGGEVPTRLIQNLDKEWISQVHRHRREHGRTKYLLLDFDRDNVFVPSNSTDTLTFARALLEKLTSSPLRGNLAYACTTPSRGLHIVLSIDKNVENEIYRRQYAFEEEIYGLAEATNFPLKEIEYKTGQVLTHIPGVNSTVKVFFPEIPA